MAVLPPDPVYILRNIEMGAVNSLCFHNGARLFAGTLKGTVHLWDLAINRSVLTLKTGHQPVLSMFHFSDSLYTQSKGSKLKMWTITNSGYDFVREIEQPYAGFCRMEFIADKKTVLLPKDDNELGIYDLENLCLRGNLKATDCENLGSVMCLKYINLSGQNYLLASYESGDFLTWDLRCSKVINRKKLEEEGPLSVDYEVNTNRGIYGGTTDRIGVFSLNRNTMEIDKKTEISVKNPGIDSVRIRNDCKVFATGGWDGRVRIFSWKSLRPLAVLTDHKDGVLDICYSSDKISLWKSHIMAAGGKDGQISLWDIYN